MIARTPIRRMAAPKNSSNQAAAGDFMRNHTASINYLQRTIWHVAQLVKKDDLSEDFRFVDLRTAYVANNPPVLETVRTP